MSKSKPKKACNAAKYQVISDNIVYYRKLAGLNQSQLAQKIDVTQPYMSKIESPNTPSMCSLEVLFDIADALEIPAYQLLKPLKKDAAK